MKTKRKVLCKVVRLSAGSSLGHILWLTGRVVASRAPITVHAPQEPPLFRQALREIHLKPVEFNFVPEVPLLMCRLARPGDNQRRTVRTLDPDGLGLSHE